MANDLDVIRVLSRPETLKMVGLSDRTWDRLEARGETPPKTRISRNRIGYRVADILRWLDQRREHGGSRLMTDSISLRKCSPEHKATSCKARRPVFMGVTQTTGHAFRANAPPGRIARHLHQQGYVMTPWRAVHIARLSRSPRERKAKRGYEPDKCVHRGGAAASVAGRIGIRHARKMARRIPRAIPRRDNAEPMIVLPWRGRCASMLRVVLIENLRRCADRIVSGRAQREAADALADRLLGSPTRPAEPVETGARRLRATGSLPRTLAVQLVQRLRDCDPDVTPALQRVEELLRAEGVTADSVVRDELQRQGAANVTVRNIVTSLVQLSALDWADIVEQLSAVDAVLGSQSDFSGLDFATRNRYRSAIEEIARDSRCARDRGGAPGNCGRAAEATPARPRRRKPATT